MEALISNLINQDESVYLEFKMQWYWQDGKGTQKEWGEFLKDFAALINCQPAYVSNNKYLIIGVEEKKTEPNKLYDVSLQKMGFDSVEELKKKIDEKISEFFYFENNDEIEQCYKIKQGIFSGKKLLYFVVNPVSSLMVLAKDLQDKKRTEKRSNVFIRELKDKNDPQVANASPSIITEFKERFKSHTLINSQNLNIGKSVDKTIRLFLQKNGIFRENGYEKEKIWDKKILFELYNLKSDFTDDIDFIYLFKDSNQIRTRDYIISNNLISEYSKKYILIDDGLSKDVAGIKSKFGAEGVYSLSDFALSHLYKDLLDDDIFHDGNFRKQRQIKNFIEPYARSSDEKNALIMLNEWFSVSSDPLMVVKGYGGVGKTTLVKYFLDQVYRHNFKKENGYKILFIDSKKIIDEISVKGSIDNLFYFYDAFANVNNVENKFNRELLELSLDNGNLLIVVDGIDEVIAKLNNKFDVNRFISSIFENYLIGSAKTKIVLTCRDYFWDSNTDDSFNINKLDLKPFTEELAKELFEKEYNINSKEFRNCVKYSNEFKLQSQDKDGKDVYIPYILDVIMDIVKQNRDLGETAKDDIESDLLNVDLTDDYFVGRICNREIEKLNNVSVDQQLMVFMRLAVFHNGIIHDDSIDKIFNDIENIDESDLSVLFKGHPFITYDTNSKIISFKYDFFKEFFINLYICSFLMKRDVSILDYNIEDNVCEYVKYNSSFTNRISKRVDLCDELEIFIIELIEVYINKLKDKESLSSRKMISGLVCILLSYENMKSGQSTPEGNSKLIEDVFGPNFDYLSIVNVLGKENDKPIFDFRGKTISHAWIENYPFFWECKLDDFSSFYHSTFKHLEPRNKVKIPKIHDKFFVKCDTSGIKEIIESSDEAHTEKENSVRNDIKRIFRFFESSGTFKEQKVEYIEKHVNHIVLKKLVKKKVINPYRNPKKPTIRQYKISDDYFDVIKVLDQSGSCFELEKAIQIIKD